MPKSIAREDDTTQFTAGMPCTLDLSDWEPWNDMSTYLVDAAVHTLTATGRDEAVLDIVDPDGNMHGTADSPCRWDSQVDAIQACVEALHGQPGVVESIAVEGPWMKALYVNFRLWNGALLNAISTYHLRAGRRIRASQ